jgi:DNA-binding NarL/FixJ family response regulator
MIAIKAVLSGKRYISPGISESVIEGYLEGRKASRVRTSWETLTPREREILKLIAEGYKNKAIADYLCISPKTVEQHKTRIFKKLEVSNQAAAAAVLSAQGGLAWSPSTT